jgi:hypothetical protein
MEASPQLRGSEIGILLQNRVPRQAAFSASSFPSVHVHPNKCETNNDNLVSFVCRYD